MAKPINTIRYNSLRVSLEDVDTLLLKLNKLVNIAIHYYEHIDKKKAEEFAYDFIKFENNVIRHPTYISCRIFIIWWNSHMRVLNGCNLDI